MTRFATIAALLTVGWAAVQPVRAQQFEPADDTPPRPVVAPRATPKPTYANGIPTLTQLINDIVRAELDMNGNLLVYSYGQSIRDPGLALGALSHLMTDYYTLRTRSESAQQASQAVDEALLRFAVLQAAQNQVAIQQSQRMLEQNEQLLKQNQKMIELLERMAPATPAKAPGPPPAASPQ